MCIYRDNLDYAQMRLDGSLVLVKGAVCHLQSMGGGDYRTKNLSTKRVGIVSIKEDHIDLTPISLGYVNYKGQAYYLSRIPRREWVQGLKREAVHLRASEAQRTTPRLDRILIPILQGRCINNTAMGRYPSFDESLRRVLARTKSWAFDRYFALEKRGDNVFLLYKANTIGKVEVNGIVLYPAYTYLTEMLIDILKHNFIKEK